MTSKRLAIARGHVVHVAVHSHTTERLIARMRVVRHVDHREVFSRPHVPFPIEQRRSVLQWAAEVGVYWIAENI